MKLIRNSVSVPVIDTLAKAIIETGVFKNEKKLVPQMNKSKLQPNSKIVETSI